MLDDCVVLGFKSNKYQFHVYVDLATEKSLADYYTMLRLNPSLFPHQPFSESLLPILCPGFQRLCIWTLSDRYNFVLRTTISCVFLTPVKLFIFSSNTGHSFLDVVMLSAFFFFLFNLVSLPILLRLHHQG